MTTYLNRADEEQARQAGEAAPDFQDGTLCMTLGPGWIVETLEGGGTGVCAYVRGKVGGRVDPGRDLGLLERVMAGVGQRNLVHLVVHHPGGTTSAASLTLNAPAESVNVDWRCGERWNLHDAARETR